MRKESERLKEDGRKDGGRGSQGTLNEDTIPSYLGDLIVMN
jgi:hypothetical protein